MLPTHGTAQGGTSCHPLVRDTPMQPCEPQLSSCTLPGAISCGIQEKLWCLWVQCCGCCPSVVSLSAGVSCQENAMPCALQSSMVCPAAGIHLGQENALQHQLPGSLLSPLLCHQAQSEATREFIKPGCTLETSFWPDWLPHGGTAGTPLQCRDPLCGTEHPRAHCAPPRTGGAEPRLSPLHPHPIPASSIWGH